MGEYLVISDREGYHRALDEISSGRGPIAVDAERASGFRYSQRAYLIQIYRQDAGTFLLDPPALGRLNELQTLIGDEQWILHAASQDLACLREVGLDPHSLFDTELAARLLGMPRVGLGTVVEELLGIHLKKEHSAADWSTRPIPDSWLEYAAYDVEYLIDLRDALTPLLEAAGKQDFAIEEFQAELDRPPKTPRADPWRRLSGIHSIKGIRHLAVARELWLARDELARATDTAPGRLIPDSSLVAAARALPRSKHALAAMREFNGRTSRTEIDRWWAAIERGQTTEDLPVLKGNGESLPPTRSWRERRPEAAHRLELAKSSVQELSEERNIPLENVLTPDYLRRISWNPPEQIGAEDIGRVLEEFGARPWQISLTAPVISAAFVEADQNGDAAGESGS